MIDEASFRAIAAENLRLRALLVQACTERDACQTRHREISGKLDAEMRRMAEIINDLTTEYGA